tara:strand:- start:969 stop:1163 length:195 start_codon:yes stop_codon:yes gene_type:complete
LGAENLPLNVISFSLSLSVLRLLKAEREKERTMLVPFARGSAQRREATRRNYDLKTIERKKKAL